MKRLLCVAFSLFLLISLLTVSSVADDGEPPVTEEQQTELTVADDTAVDDTSSVDDVLDAESSEEPVTEESEEVDKNDDEDSYIFPETISLSPDVELAILQINSNLYFLLYGVVPLMAASVLGFLFYKWFAKTFF